VHGVIGRKDTVDYGFCAFDGEVAVNSTMVFARGDEVRAVRLGFRCCPGQERKRVSRKLSRRRRRRRVVEFIPLLLKHE